MNFFVFLFIIIWILVLFLNNKRINFRDLYVVIELFMSNKICLFFNNFKG